MDTAVPKGAAVLFLLIVTTIYQINFNYAGRARGKKGKDAEFSDICYDYVTK